MGFTTMESSKKYRKVIAIATDNNKTGNAYITGFLEHYTHKDRQASNYIFLNTLT